MKISWPEKMCENFSFNGLFWEIKKIVEWVCDKLEFNKINNNNNMWKVC